MIEEVVDFRNVPEARLRYSVLISEKTRHFSMIMICWLMLFNEIIAVYSDNNTKPINTISEQNEKLLIVKVCGKYRYG